MRKRWLFTFVCLMFVFLFSSSKVEAKSYSDDDISLEFGEDNNLNMYYQGYNKFDLSDTNQFYYNGNLYTLSEEDITNGSITVEGETLTYNSEGYLTSATNKEFYAFHIDVLVKSSDTYVFSQEVCYKYGSVEDCNIDSGDTMDITTGDSPHNFFYGFLPFYDESIVFDYIYFNLTFTNKSDNSDVIEINNFGFNISKGDTINYKDHFIFSVYDYGYNTFNNDKNYIKPLCLYNNYPGVVADNCYDGLALTIVLESYSANLVSLRDYKFTFEIYVGESYSDVYTVNNDDVLIILSNGFYNYVAPFDGNINNIEGYLIYIPLTNINYSYSSNTLGHVSFKFNVSYVCENKTGNDCSDARAVTSKETISNTYELNVDTPSIDIEVEKGVELPSNTTYHFANTDEVIIKSIFSDHNGIEDIGYFISRNSNESNLASKTYTSVPLNDNVSVSGEEGAYYLYYRVKDKAGSDYVYFKVKILIDNSAPNMISNNFDEYSESESYSNVKLNINYVDTYLDGLSNPTIASKAYYKVIKESEKDSVTLDDIVNNNLVYTNVASINKDLVSEDGTYLVCFILEDYLGNQSVTPICSLNYYMDVTALTKEEVSATSSDEYEIVVKTTITIMGVDNGVSFKCALSKTSIESENELTNTCYNGVEASLKVNDEAIYNIWIYASDNAGNYSLIKLDNEFYVDSLAPRITKSITGDNSVYSNNVNINVEAVDLSDIDEDKLTYGFYLATYDENEFVSFTLEDGISYPYDYYGSYKLAIKVCDIIGNCKIYTDTTNYLIDTAKITIELIGEKTITILQYQKYKELGANASKGNAGRNVVNVEYKVSGEVDTNKPGTYKIVYSSGEGINKVSVEREVVVKSSKYYIVSLVSLFVIGELIILARLFIKKRKNDNI